MGLGLGSGLTTGTMLSWSPTDTTGLSLWFKKRLGIFVKFNDGGDETYSPLRSFGEGNVEDSDRIIRWVGNGGTDKDFYQATSDDMPRAEISQAHEGSLFFASAAKFMNLVEAGSTTGTTVALSGAFTVLVRLQPTDLSASRGILGQTGVTTEFVRFGAGASNLDDSVRMKIDNNTVDFTDSGSNTFPTNEYTNLLIERDSSNVCKMYVYSNSYKSTASGTQWGGATTQSGTATFDNLGCTDDDTTKFQGYISDLIVWSSQLTAEERELAFKYTGL